MTVGELKALLERGAGAPELVKAWPELAELLQGVERFKGEIVELREAWIDADLADRLREVLGEAILAPLVELIRERSERAEKIRSVLRMDRDDA